MAPTLIGLAGYARAGKDTAASHLAPFGYERVAFADALREALTRLDPLIELAGVGRVYLSWALDSRETWESLKTNAPEVRRLLQRLGTEVGRDFLGPNVWVDRALAQLPPLAVVTDVRFPNEADAIRARGGVVWRVVRPGFGPANQHPSETAMDSYRADRCLHNDGTPADLAAAVAALLS